MYKAGCSSWAHMPSMTVAYAQAWEAYASKKSSLKTRAATVELAVMDRAVMGSCVDGVTAGRAAVVSQHAFVKHL